jgi:hypothetical protein
VRSGSAVGEARLASHVMRRIKLKLSYDGTDFHGWQVQPELATIQGTLEAVLFQIEGSPVHVEGSGRTDAGVHALEQVAGCSIQNPIPLDNLIHAMNRLLPPTIREAYGLPWDTRHRLVSDWLVAGWRAWRASAARRAWRRFWPARRSWSIFCR